MIFFNADQMHKPKINRDTKELVKAAPQIQSILDAEKNALGFWPPAQLMGAIKRDRLRAAQIDDEICGFLIHSGVYPHAKVQAVATAVKYRQSGVASFLIRSLIADLEGMGYLTIKAEVANDLAAALRFYQYNGFEPVYSKPGGKTRNRKIIVHILELDNPSLFSALDTPNQIIDLGIRKRSAGDSPLYAFDLNVYLDLAHNREQSDLARELFGSALAHTIRLAVATEFVVELERNSTNAPAGDPVLSLALSLPKIPKVNQIELSELSARIYQIAFGSPKKEEDVEQRKLSDANHLAHAALARASAFVTRDGALLIARNEILAQIGIDVISLAELVELLPANTGRNIGGTARAESGFEIREATQTEAVDFLSNLGLSHLPIETYFPSSTSKYSFCTRAVFRSGSIVAFGVVKLPNEMQPIANMLVCVDVDDADCETFADHILETLTRHASDKSPIEIELANIAGQATVNSLALSRGFGKSSRAAPLKKVALGKVITESTWVRCCQQIYRQTGLDIQLAAPSTPSETIAYENREGVRSSIQARELETALSPALVIVGDCTGALVPIQKKYADALLGTSRQPHFPFIEKKEAAFVSLRSYVNSPRLSSIMLPERPIFFYESKSQGGRGAVVAVARIQDAVVLRKENIPDGHLRRLVVEDVGEFSTTDEVLLTTFDQLFELPQEVPLSELRKMAAIDRSNLPSAKKIPYKVVNRILDWGWSDEKL
ncbi:MAG: GNAT family N-acetyltransferase [Rhizobiaceae bacterium]